MRFNVVHIFLEANELNWLSSELYAPLRCDGIFNLFNSHNGNTISRVDGGGGNAWENDSMRRMDVGYVCSYNYGAQYLKQINKF